MESDLRRIQVVEQHQFALHGIYAVNIGDIHYETSADYYKRRLFRSHLLTDDGDESLPVEPQLLFKSTCQMHGAVIPVGFDIYDIRRTDF